MKTEPRKPQKHVPIMIRAHNLHYPLFSTKQWVLVVATAVWVVKRGALESMGEKYGKCLESMECCIPEWEEKPQKNPFHSLSIKMK